MLNSLIFVTRIKYNLIRSIKIDHLKCCRWYFNAMHLQKCFFFLIQELRRFPTLQSDIAAASNESLEKFREESRKTVLRLVDMESSYLTVEFFRKIHQIEPEKNPNRNGQESFTDMHLRKIGMWSPTNFLITCITYRFISNKLGFWITPVISHAIFMSSLSHTLRV